MADRILAGPGGSGIYAITNRANGKRYIGQSSALRDRWLFHKSALRRGKHCNRIIQNAWNRYGEAAFEFTIIEEAKPEDLCEREQHWIDTLRPEYNIAPVAGTTRGMKHPPRTAEFRERMRKQSTGRKHSPESIERMRAIPGRPLSAEAKAKLAAHDRSYLHSPEAVAKRREKMVGRKWSPEVVEKRRAANIGRKRTPEQCRRIGDAIKASYAERRARGIVQMSPMKGRVRSEETKRKDAAAKLGGTTGRGSLTPAQVREVRRLNRDEGLGRKRIAKRMNISPSAANAVIRGDAYLWVK